MAKRIVICIMLGVGTVAVWIVHSYRLESLGFRRVTVTAVLSDGEGNPVRGVPVTLWTGENSERRFHQIFRRVSNRAGRASARGWAQTGVGCSTAGNVYYPSRGERLIAFAETPREARHSVEIPIPMRRVRNPVRMRVGYFSTANTRPGVCFDLVKGDYLPPYGRGEAADMAAVWRQTGGDGAHSGDTTYDLLFTNGVDGVTAAADRLTDDPWMCDFQSDYAAPASGYTNRLHFASTRIGTPFTRWGVRYFRIRTMTDSEGAVTNALYGKIYGTPDLFRYYVNPTPNDRNVEAARGVNLRDLTDYDFMP